MRISLLVLGGVFSSLCLGDTYEALKGRLNEQCFVWNRAKCSARHKSADQMLIGRFKEDPAAASNQAVAEGQSLLSKGDFETALKRFNQALILQPKNADAWVLAATTYSILNIENPGIQVVEKAIELRPQEPSLYVNLGRFYAPSNPKKGKELFLKALEKDPKFADAFIKLAYLSKQTGQTEEQKKWVLKAKEAGADIPAELSAK